MHLVLIAHHKMNIYYSVLLPEELAQVAQQVQVEELAQVAQQVQVEELALPEELAQVAQLEWALELEVYQAVKRLTPHYPPI